MEYKKKDDVCINQGDTAEVIHIHMTFYGNKIWMKNLVKIKTFLKETENIFKSSNSRCSFMNPAVCQHVWREN